MASLYETVTGGGPSTGTGVAISIPGYSIGPPTTYRVVVTDDNGTFELSRRFSDFLKLAQDVEDEMAEPVPVAPPAKKWFGASNPEVLESRREGLETMLRAIVRAPDFYETLAVSSFLELSKHKATPSRAVDWIKGTSRLNELVSQARATESSRRPRLVLEAKALLGQLQKQVRDRTGPSGASSSGQAGEYTGAGEAVRRQSVLDEYLRTLSSLETWGSGSDLNAEALGSVASGSRVGYAGTSGGVGTGRTDTARVGSGRVLGETDTTRRLNNAELLQHQQEQVQEQDATIDNLRLAIARQRELGLAIDAEVTAQNQLLDELDSEVHQSNVKLNQARRKAGKLA